MPSAQSSFQPLPPIRTNTGDSQKSYCSGAMSPGSDVLSPTSTYARGMHSPTSPAEQSFFGALTSRVRRGRSQSRNRTGKSRDRSKSPLVLPPDHMPFQSNAAPMSPTFAAKHPQQPVRASNHNSRSTPTTKQKRPGMPPAPQRTSSDMWRGRHSNEWLFNGFSVTQTTKDLLQRRKS